MPSVATGEAIYPILTTAPTVATPAESVAAGEAAATFTADVLVPKRVQAAFRYTREDRARFAGMDSALRENLSMGISDKLDSELLSGAGGLFTGTTLADHASGSAVTTYAQYRSQLLFSRIDGRYANGVGEIKILMGGDSYAHAAGQYRGANDNMDALMSLISQSGGVRVSSHVPDTSATKQEALVRLGMRRDFVQPVWDSVEIIPDEITAADEGEIIITAVRIIRAKIAAVGRILQAGTESFLMAGVLLSGPAGAGKTQRAKAMIDNAATPTVAADFQALYASLLQIERLPNGRYPERLESQAYALAMAEYLRRVIMTRCGGTGHRRDNHELGRVASAP